MKKRLPVSLLFYANCDGEVEHGPPVERLLRYRQIELLGHAVHPVAPCLIQVVTIQLVLALVYGTQFEPNAHPVLRDSPAKAQTDIGL